MSAPSISIARVVGQRIPIAWQEAVAVASLAEQRSIELGLQLDLDRCLISTAGEIQLRTDAPRDPATTVSALGLLAILLEGQPAPAPLRSLIAAGDNALAVFPSERERLTMPRYELSWFLSPVPYQEVSRLAARSLAHAEAEAIREVLHERQEAEASAKERDAAFHRGPGVTMRIARMSPRIAAGIVFSVTVGAVGAVTVGLLAGAPIRPSRERAAATASSRPVGDGAADMPNGRRAGPVIGDEAHAGFPDRAEEIDPVPIEPGTGRH